MPAGRQHGRVGDFEADGTLELVLLARRTGVVVVVVVVLVVRARGKLLDGRGQVFQVGWRKVAVLVELVNQLPNVREGAAHGRRCLLLRVARGLERQQRVVAGLAQPQQQLQDVGVVAEHRARRVKLGKHIARPRVDALRAGWGWALGLIQ